MSLAFEGEQTRPAASGTTATVRVVRCRSLLNRSKLGDYSLNCYTGCEHACVYCYARYMQRFHPHDEPWGRFVDVKSNAIEVLVRQIRRLPPGSVFTSSACDGWQPIEAERQLTRRAVELLARHGFTIDVLTKSALVLRDLDVLAGRSARIGVTLTTLDEELARLWEPGAASVEARLGALDEARRRGLRTAVMFGPLLPGLSDDPGSLDRLFRQAARLRVGTIWTDALNPRPLVWPAVSRLVEERFPDLGRLYRQVLFDARARGEYLAGLRQRVRAAAERAGVSDRLAGDG